MTEVLSVSREGEGQSAEGLLLKFVFPKSGCQHLEQLTKAVCLPETRPVWSPGFLSRFLWALVPLSQAGTPLSEPASPLPATDPDQAPHGPSAGRKGLSATSLGACCPGGDRQRLQLSFTL